MTNALWNKVVELFEANENTILHLRPCPATPSAQYCRESAHRTLGHLTACQAAWLPFLQQIRAGEKEGTIPVNPDPLYRKLGYSQADWTLLVGRFITDREQWREALEEVNMQHEIRTPKRVYTAQTLTRRLVEHEKRHLDDLSLAL